jgi:hypothetical protein
LCVVCCVLCVVCCVLCVVCCVLCASVMWCCCKRWQCWLPRFVEAQRRSRSTPRRPQSAQYRLAAMWRPNRVETSTTSIRNHSTKKHCSRETIRSVPPVPDQHVRTGDSPRGSESSLSTGPDPPRKSPKPATVEGQVGPSCSLVRGQACGAACLRVLPHFSLLASRSVLRCEPFAVMRARKRASKRASNNNHRVVVDEEATRSASPPPTKV